MKKISSKTILFLGLLFIILSFGCIAGVLYQFYLDHQEASREVVQMREKIIVLDTDKSIAEEKLREFSKRVGQEIEFDKLLSAAEEKYGDQERERREGDLWIDKQSKDWMITLGAINGMKKGTRLRVLDSQDKQIGVVVIDSILDVVSYVYPLEERGQYTQDIYKVVLE